MTRGLAFAVVVLVIGLDRLTGASSARIEPSGRCDGLGGYVQALSLSADGRTLYACTSDGGLTAWEPGSLPSHMAGGAETRQRKLAASAPNSSMLAFAERGRTVVVHDLSTGRRESLSSSVGVIGKLALSGDGATLAMADEAGVRLLDAVNGRPLAWPPLEVNDVMSLAFSPDDRILAIGCKDGMIRLRRTGEGVGASGPVFGAHGQSVTSLSFTADGTVLASASHEGTEVRLWRAVDGRPVAKLKSHTCIQAIAFAPVGQVLAMAGRDGSIRVCDAATPSLPGVLLPRDDPATAIAFSSDGTALACGGVGSIRLFRVDDIAQGMTR